MANGYDSHSLKVTRANEAATSSDTTPLVAVRDKRFTRSGIGYRSQATEASSLDPGGVGQTPPPIMYGDSYLGGVATRRRGGVNEAKLSWETAQEATSPQIRPRETLPPSGMREALPPWLKGDDEEREALPPWLQDKADGQKKGARRPGMGEDGEWDGREGGDEGGDTGFPDEEDARDALSTLSQFVDSGTLKAIQNQIVKQYGDPGDDGETGVATPGFMGEAASTMAEAPLDAKKRNDLPSSDFAMPGRKYPIDTPERARSALARVEQFGSPEDQRKVKAAVQKKYPNMSVD